MKKILIVSTVSRQFYLFEQGNIEVLKSLGYEIHAAANFSDANERLDALDIIRHPFDIQRSPLSLKNLKAYKQLKKIMESENFDAVHCHSPMGGVLARLAARSVGISPVIYTAHGFHFYKGAPIINWLVFYPVERYLSKYTDVLITINNEDYNEAQKFKAKKVIYVPGIGVDTNKITKVSIDIDRKREELGITSDTVVLLSIGEMIKRKNHETVLKAIANLKDQNLVYLICGKGELESYLKGLVKTLGIEEKVRFLGYRNDIPEICNASDLFLFPSYQEGLPVSVMEAMSAGLPVICSSIRGNTDLIENEIGGYLLEPDDVEGFAKKINKLINNQELLNNMGNNNKESVKRFDKKEVKNKMEEIYKYI
ncbi:glycosyltransferase family 4 protein [Schinkia azotoformans]|uniref:glycosyltransferase family 4 protein n=1 Tax=Schinkia azotoformans TaxID=1454 RepID=UPI002DBEBA5B|nr:glycosyltransferase family 4 protein [Schinkia azotoformans]MEC1771902.1 glycosyltransferase family 4 protein [Schinkia azotoformans]MED4366400.1 glycosyltransferase family 4 protein [Schinkia azotoformans]